MLLRSTARPSGDAFPRPAAYTIRPEPTPSTQSGSPTILDSLCRACRDGVVEPAHSCQKFLIQVPPGCGNLWIVGEDQVFRFRRISGQIIKLIFSGVAKVPNQLPLRRAIAAQI